MLMTDVEDIFRNFLDNLKISKDRKSKIRIRYAEITKRLNQKFRGNQSDSNNNLQVGSFGRNTAINNVSDLDMLYIMPQCRWEYYKNEGPAKLLDDVKDVLKGHYSSTVIKKDRLVVQIQFSDSMLVELQPVFKNEDCSFSYPDTYNDGTWKKTKPCEEIKAMRKLDSSCKNSNARNLCKMLRAWKDQNDIDIGGLLIDTLAYNFFTKNEIYKNFDYSQYEELFISFFDYLSGLEPSQSVYKALGSNQNVRVKHNFVGKAKEALDIVKSVKNCSSINQKVRKWRILFGKYFPTICVARESLNEDTIAYKDTEEFILLREVISSSIEINCTVEEKGFRAKSLRDMLLDGERIHIGSNLTFFIKTDESEPYSIKWKVLNRGYEAKRRNCIRGQIEEGKQTKTEKASFEGDHVVECYIIKNNIVVAKNYINVPIEKRRA